jgi:GDP-L-fucose synthase
MTKKKVLVCGATGFIGRNVAERLATHDDVEVFGTYFKSPSLSNPRIEMSHADLRREDDVNRVVNGMDVIVQTAAITTGSKDTVERPYIHVTDNAVMNSLLLRAAFDNHISHFIFPSCTVMYQSSDVPLKEKDFNPSDEIFPSYFGVGNTKVYIERMCEFFSRLGRTKHTAMRHSNIYGPYDKFTVGKSHVFGATISTVTNAPEGSNITMWGTGEEKRDLLYVSDLVDFVELAIEKQHSPYELYNVGYGSSISVKDLVKKVIEISGKDLGVEFDPTKPSIKTRLALDSSKALADFGWRPKTSLDEGIQKTLDWYKENGPYR